VEGQVVMRSRRMLALLLCALFLGSLTGTPTANASSVKVEIEMHVYQPINKKFDRFQVRLGDEFPSRSFLSQKFLSNCKKLRYFGVGDKVKVFTNSRDETSKVLTEGKITSVKIGEIYYKRYFGEDGETYNEYFAPCIFTGTVPKVKYKSNVGLCIKNFFLPSDGSESHGVGGGPRTGISAWWTGIHCEGFEKSWTFCWKQTSFYNGC
jgi:hypothetical protein